MESNFTSREQVVETVNRLYVYVDEQAWDKLLAEVFAEQVTLDMSSLGGPDQQMLAKDICDMWAAGFEGIDAINHLAGNYLVSFGSPGKAEVFAYATATHYKESAVNGKTREFVGTYEIGLSKLDEGWRVDKLAYQLKYLNGNTELT